MSVGFENPSNSAISAGFNQSRCIMKLQRAAKLKTVFGLVIENGWIQQRLKEIFRIARRRSRPTVLSVQAKIKSRKEGCDCCVCREKKVHPVGGRTSTKHHLNLDSD